MIYNLSENDESAIPAGVRQFSISINGNMLLKDLNLARDYGALRAVDFTTLAEARNGSGIEIAFESQIGKSTLSGIRIERIE